MGRGGWIGLLNIVKYPPGLVFLALTLGINFLLMQLFSWADRRGSRALEPLAVFGRTPLLFYILHLYLYAVLGLWLAPEGMPIPQMLAVWALGLAVLYPVCLWYGRFKSSRPAESLWRLL